MCYIITQKNSSRALDFMKYLKMWIQFSNIGICSSLSNCSGRKVEINLSPHLRSRKLNLSYDLLKTWYLSMQYITFIFFSNITILNHHTYSGEQTMDFYESKPSLSISVKKSTLGSSS